MKAIYVSPKAVTRFITEEESILEISTISVGNDYSVDDPVLVRSEFPWDAYKDEE